MSRDPSDTKFRPKWLMPIAIIAIIFGIATIISGGKSLFTEAGRIAAGNYVPFVLWFNFLAGFLYVITGIGLARARAWSSRLAAFLAVTTSLVFLFFGIHIMMNGAYEMRTVLAMILRSGFWLMAARFAWALQPESKA